MIELNYAFFFQLINFAVLIIVLNKFMYQPIRKVLAERRGVIDAAREKTVAVDCEVQAKMAQYEAKLKEAKLDALARKGEALLQAKQEETRLIEDARNNAATALLDIRERVTRESAEAKQQLRVQSDALSGVICEKILGRGL